MTACEDALSKANDPCFHLGAVDVAWLESSEDERDLGSLAQERSHVGIHHLQIVTTSETQSPKLIASFSLRHEVWCTNEQWMHARNDLDNLQAIMTGCLPSFC